jgi:hypothetical protein
MKIILNDKTLDLGKGISHGCDVRAKLPPEQYNYSMYRERKGKPDELIMNSQRVFSNDIIYTVPPCHGA